MPHMRWHFGVDMSQLEMSFTYEGLGVVPVYAAQPQPEEKKTQIEELSKRGLRCLKVLLSARTDPFVMEFIESVEVVRNAQGLRSHYQGIEAVGPKMSLSIIEMSEGQLTHFSLGIVKDGDEYVFQANNELAMAREVIAAVRFFHHRGGEGRQRAKKKTN